MAARQRDSAADVPDHWAYAEAPRVCAACGSDDDRHVVVDSLGLVWGAAMERGLAPTELGDYAGTLEFRCCHDCWTGRNVEVLDEARTLADREARAEESAFALDDEKVAAARRLDAERVAVGRLWRLDLRSVAEREHVGAQDEAIAALLEAESEK